MPRALTSPAVFAALALVAMLGGTSLCVADAAHAGTCTVDALPSSGSVTPSHFNRRYDQVEGCINGNLGDANISSSEPITTSKLAKPAAVAYVTAQISCSTDTDAFSWKPPFASEIVSFHVSCGSCAGNNHTVALKVGASTIDSTVVTDETPYTSALLSTDISTATEASVVVTENVAGICSGLHAVIGLKTTHLTAP
jgi:hypothetical protein